MAWVQVVYEKILDRETGKFRYLDRRTGVASERKPTPLGSADLVCEAEEAAARAIQLFWCFGRQDSSVSAMPNPLRHARPKPVKTKSMRQERRHCQTVLLTPRRKQEPAASANPEQKQAAVRTLFCDPKQPPDKENLAPNAKSRSKRRKPTKRRFASLFWKRRNSGGRGAGDGHEEPGAELRRNKPEQQLPSATMAAAR